MQRLFNNIFYGWVVVGAAFVIAIFGWGVGFYGPAIYLNTVQVSRGWSVGLASVAVTLHFLVGAFVVANLPRLHQRFGLSSVTIAGACTLALGVICWAIAIEPWQLLLATLLSGSGWVALGAAGINAMLLPWFAHKRPVALAMAYNGASIGGVIFSPLWVALITAYGFRAAALLVGITMVCVVSFLAHYVLKRSPHSMGLVPDGLLLQAQAVIKAKNATVPARVIKPWRDRAFITLVSGMALGLFAQIGLIAHLYSLLVPSLGLQTAGVVAGLATAAAILGRTVVGWTLRPNADRRYVAAASYGVQIAGCFCMATAGTNVETLIFGVFLFGLGIGNATSLPPMIAQIEFSKEDVSRIVALVTAVSQGTYAFAPAVFGFIRHTTGTALPSINPVIFWLAAGVQLIAAICYISGRNSYLARPQRSH
jgi:MFS family permease